MAHIHVVTDSAARFGNPRLIEPLPVTVLPNTIEVAGKRYREDVDISAEDLLRLLKQQESPPRIIPPDVETYARTYARLSRMYDGIISVHPSRELSQSWYNAQQAAQQVTGKCEIAVIDTRSICAGQGMLVRVAGEAAREMLDVETTVKRVRGAVERVYTMLCGGSLEYLERSAIMSRSHAILGSMLGVKPFLSIEEGQLVIIEKVRTQSQVVDRMIEFLIEFDTLDDATIIQPRARITEQTRVLQDRLSVEFPGQHFPFSVYGGSLAALLGTDVTGIVVLESEMDMVEDDL